MTQSKPISEELLIHYACFEESPVDPARKNRVQRLRQQEAREAATIAAGISMLE